MGVGPTSKETEQGSVRDSPFGTPLDVEVIRKEGRGRLVLGTDQSVSFVVPLFR